MNGHSPVTRPPVMQPRSYPATPHPRLRVHPSAAADALKAELLGAEHPPPVATDLLARIGAGFVDDMHGPAVGADRRYVLVLRGGLLLWPAVRRRVPAGVSGIIVPKRDARHGDPPAVVYASVTVSDASEYVLLDTLIASGATMLACAAELRRHTGTAHISFAAPFAAGVGWRRLLDAYPTARVYCVWHDERIDGDGRMVGPGFDVGAFALGATPADVVWTSP